MNSKYRVILISGAIIAVLIIIAAVAWGMHNSSMAAYSSKLAEADQLMDDGDYSNAILKYQEAIDDKPKEERGYLSLASAYEVTGHTDYAIQTLEAGIAMIPGSNALASRYSELTGGAVKSDIVKTIDIGTLTSLSAKSYYDYTMTNGIEQISPLKEGAVKVRVKGINADLIYKNTTDQPEAVVGKTPNSDSIPAEVSFDNVMSIFGGGPSITIAELKELGAADVKVVDHQEYGTAVTFKYDIYTFTVQSDSDGKILAGAENVVTMPAPSQQPGADIKVSGTAVNALNGNGVDSAKLTFTKGGGGDPVEITTDSSGEYSIKLASGEYTVNCQADGFIEEDKTIYVPSSASEWTCDLVMSPDISNGEARIVLTWGSHPADLDSHLLGSGTHISFENMSDSNASLDIDDTNGNGPETTTIHDLKDSYTFVVQDYTKSGDLAGCGATVTVYLPGQSPVVIDVPGSGGSDTWVVFTLDNGKLDIVNEIKEFDL